MEFEQLEIILKGDNSELPINRKERFYTATILPFLLFSNGLQNLFEFLHHIPGFPIEVNYQNTKDNLLFYSEYNLKESAFDRNIGRKIVTNTGDTPDLIVEILKPFRIFIVIEGKMFAKLTQEQFSGQMEAQRIAIIEPIKAQYPDAQIFHVALLPEQFNFKSLPEYPVLNWQMFIKEANFQVADNYFTPFLKFALNNYEVLKSLKTGMSATIQSRKTGAEINQSGLEGRLIYVGRQGGKIQIEQDIMNDDWEDRPYAVNCNNPRKGQKGNWITSIDFAKIVNKALS
jgi:hypothetical protein